MATVRVTRTYADVAGTLTHEGIHFSTYGIQVLYGPITEWSRDAGSVITFTQEARNAAAAASASSELELTHSVTILGAAKAGNASSSLVVTSSAGSIRPWYRGVQSVLAMTQTAKSPIALASATSTLVLGVTARKAESLIVSASNAIAASQTGTCSNMHVKASSAINLLSIGEHRVKYRDVEHQLTLTDVASTDQIRTANNILYLTDAAINGQVRLFVESPIALGQVARNVSINVRAVSSDIDIVDEARSSIYWAQVETAINLADSNRVIKPIYVSGVSELVAGTDGTDGESVVDFDQENLDLVDLYKGLTHEAIGAIDPTRLASSIVSFATWTNGYALRPDAIAADATDTLSLTDRAVLSLVLEASNALVLTQSASGDAGKATVPSELTLSVAASYIIDRSRTAASAIAIAHACVYTLNIDRELLNSYRPFVGEGAAGVPPSSYWAASDLTGVQLRYPATGAATDIIQLRKPNFGNVQRLAMDRINRETRGGNLRIFADPVWPKTESMLLTFSTLTAAEKTSLLAFLDNHLGEDIVFIDWENRPWRGVIVSIDPFVQDTRDTFTASFEFERVFTVSSLGVSALSLLSAAIGVK